MKPNLRATLPFLLVFRQDVLVCFLPACMLVCVRVCIIRFNAFRQCGLQDYLHFLKLMLIASNLCGLLLHLRRDESPSILNTLGCYLHRPGAAVTDQGQNFVSHLESQSNQKSFPRNLKVKLFVESFFWTELKWWFSQLNAYRLPREGGEDLKEVNWMEAAGTDGGKKTQERHQLN